MDLVIESFQTDSTNANDDSGKYGSLNPIPEPNFRIVKKKHSCNESPKPTREPFTLDRSRVSPIAPSESDEEETQLRMHNATKNQSKCCTGNFKDRKRKEELTKETTGATAHPLEASRMTPTGPKSSQGEVRQNQQWQC